MNGSCVYTVPLCHVSNLTVSPKVEAFEDGKKILKERIERG